MRYNKYEVLEKLNRGQIFNENESAITKAVLRPATKDEIIEILEKNNRLLREQLEQVKEYLSEDMYQSILELEQYLDDQRW